MGTIAVPQLHIALQSDAGSARRLPTDMRGQPRSSQISKEMKCRGFKFVWSAIVCTCMQRAGVVNDHAARCLLPTSHD
jgi:3-methyladenine DNA glycosylase Tag